MLRCMSMVELYCSACLSPGSVLCFLVRTSTSLVMTSSYEPVHCSYMYQSAGRRPIALDLVRVKPSDGPHRPCCKPPHGKRSLPCLLCADQLPELQEWCCVDRRKHGGSGMCWSNHVWFNLRPGDASQRISLTELHSMRAVFANPETRTTLQGGAACRERVLRRCDRCPLQQTGRASRLHVTAIHNDAANGANGPCSSGKPEQVFAKLSTRLRSAGLPLLSASVLPLAWFGGGYGNGNGLGGSGGDGGGGDGSGGPDSSQPSILADLAAAGSDDEEEESDDDSSSSSSDDEEDAADDDGPAPLVPAAQRTETAIDDGSRFFCAEVTASGLPSGTGVPTEEELFAGLNCQPGYECTKQEVSDDLRSLYQMGLFNDVDARVEPIKGKPGKFRINFIFKEKLWPEMQSFKVKGASLLPPEVIQQVMDAKEPGPSNMQTVSKIRGIVEGWYQSHGYQFCYVREYDDMETGNWVANVVEGKVNNVNVVRMDDQGQPLPKGQGKVPEDVILRELPFKKGRLYNSEDARRALASVFGLGLFDNVQVAPKQSARDETLIDVDVMVRERPMRTSEVNAEWGFAPGPSGRPSLTSIVPGGSITFEDRNLHGDCSSLSATVDAPNFLNPGEDLGFRLEYRRPYIYGDRDPKKTALTVSAFNVRKQSAVFKADGPEFPAMFVDRHGVKVALHESYSRNSKGSIGLVLQQALDCRDVMMQIATTDEQGQALPNGVRQVGMGSFLADGPPTSHSENGVDRVLLAQGNLTRDASYFVNGCPVGARDIYTIEQSLLGSGLPFYNKQTANITRFIKLRDPPAGKRHPPMLLVLHAKGGNVIGDLASHDLFLLGGPYSVRGYNMGELGAARRFLEAAVELRVPVMGKHVYAFYERCSDLGSSPAVVGNPTQYYRKAGKGSSIGGGVRLGGLRVEYAVDQNSNKGNLFFRYGERF